MEVRPVGVTKGLGMQRLMGLIAEMEGHEKASFEFVLCIGQYGQNRCGRIFVALMYGSIAQPCSLSVPDFMSPPPTTTTITPCCCCCAQATCSHVTRTCSHFSRDIRSTGLPPTTEAEAEAEGPRLGAG